MKVGVIGLGSMGMGAALNLLQKGHDVRGGDVRAEAREELAAAGGRAVARAADLPEGLGAVIVFVVNAAQAEDVLFGPEGCLGRLAPDSVVLCCTTVAPEAARALGARLEARGVPMLDAPVSGGVAGARAGRMTVMASGPEVAFARARPVLDAIAGKVWNLGAAYGAGSTAAEALALGIRAGADPQTLFDVITTSAGNSWMFENRVPHILAGDDTPRSAVNIFVKDLGIVLDQARALTFPLPLAAAAHQLFLAAAASGHGGRDDAFVIRVWQALTGIRLPEAKS
jgi:putative dehydrogenase